MTVVDEDGRIRIPDEARAEFGFVPGTEVEVAITRDGIELRHPIEYAELITDSETGKPVATSPDTFGDQLLYELIDAGRR